MARERPTASNVTQPVLTCLDDERPDVDGPLLPRGDARGLRRSAALTHALLEAHLRGVPYPPPQTA